MGPKKRSREDGEGSNADDATAGKKAKVIDNQKSVTFYATDFIVGNFNRTGIYGLPIGIKIYFKKKLMAWEIMDNYNIKNKMEIPFANIVALHIDSFQATVKFLLNAAPSFFRDVNTFHGKRFAWEKYEDFTNGEATVKREFTFISYCNKVQEFHEKILAANSVLNTLFKWPFPAEKDPNCGC